MTRLQYFFAAFLSGIVVLLMMTWFFVLPMLGIWWVIGRVLT